MRFGENLYSFCEPFFDEKGLSVVRIPVDGTHGTMNRITELTKDDAELLDIMLRHGWDLPGNYMVNSKGQHPTEVDLKECIIECARLVDDYIRRSISFVREKDYAICTDFILSTYFNGITGFFPRLIVVGQTQSGKSKLKRVLGTLSYRGIKIGNGSFAASFRTIDEYATTTLFDEIQDYPKQQIIELMTLFKSGFEKGDTFIRCNPTTLATESFRTDSPVILLTQSMKPLKEDVLNRSFTIKMVEADNTRRFQKQRNNTKLIEIRTALYNMKYTYIIQKAHRILNPGEGFDLDAFVDHCIDILIGEEADDGVRYLEDSDIPKNIPVVNNRQLDIAMAMYPFAKLAGNVPLLFEGILESREGATKKMAISDLGMLFNSWMDCTQSTFRHFNKLKDFLAATTNVSTKEIRDQYNLTMRDMGNVVSDLDMVRTQDIRPPLESMGFELDYAHKSNNQTFITYTAYYESIFEPNINKYGSPEIKELYQKLKKKESDSAVSKLELVSGTEEEGSE